MRERISADVDAAMESLGALERVADSQPGMARGGKALLHALALHSLLPISMRVR